MPADVAAQMAIFGQGMLLGVLLGLVYDGMRTVRRNSRLRVLAFGLDLLFWLGATAALFALTLLRDDGRVRIYHMAAVLLGGGVYFATLSRLVLPALLWAAGVVRRVWRFCTAPIRRMGRTGKKVLKSQKKHFQNWLGWYKINMIYRFANNGEEGMAHETKAGGRGHKITGTGPAGGGGRVPSVHSGKAERRSGRPGRPGRFRNSRRQTPRWQTISPTAGTRSTWRTSPGVNWECWSRTRSSLWTRRDEKRKGCPCRGAWSGARAKAKLPPAAVRFARDGAKAAKRPDRLAA